MILWVVGEHGPSQADSDACHAFVTLALKMTFFITRTHPGIPENVLRTTNCLWGKGYDINYSQVYRIMKSNDFVINYQAKSKR